MRKYGPACICLTVVFLLSACAVSEKSQTDSSESGAATTDISSSVSGSENGEEASSVRSNATYDMDEMNIKNGGGGSEHSDRLFSE